MYPNHPPQTSTAATSTATQENLTNNNAQTKDEKILYETALQPVHKDIEHKDIEQFMKEIKWFTPEEYVYKHDQNYLCSVNKSCQKAKEGGGGGGGGLYNGLCTPWTAEWLACVLRNDDSTKRYDIDTDIARLIKKVGEYYKLVEKAREEKVNNALEEYFKNQGLNLAELRTGKLYEYHAFDESWSTLEAGAYLVEISPPPSYQHDTEGHVFGLHKTLKQSSKLTFFDQNFGLTKLIEWDRINQVYTKEVYEVARHFETKYDYWYIYNVRLAATDSSQLSTDTALST